MKPLNFLNEFPYEIAIIDNNPYMFTNMRIDRDTIPKVYVAYDVRESDGGAGDFASVEPFVMVNHWGTIIGKHKLPMETFNNRDFYVCGDEDGWFTGDYVESAEDFEKVVVVQEFEN